MFDASGYALFTVAVATALFHTLIPDHWLPFVLIGRARGWSVATTALVSGVSASIHVVLSILLGLAALRLGATVAAAIGEQLEQAGALLLVLFGLGYAIWSWRKGGHFHPGGARVHAEPVPHECDGTEGPANPEHLHYHADDGLIAGAAGDNAWWLALIVGVNPCVLVLPLVLESARHGAGAVMTVALAYAVPSFAMMVGLSALGVAGGRFLRLPWPARYMEAASGVLIAALGVAVALLDRH